MDLQEDSIKDLLEPLGRSRLRRKLTERQLAAAPRTQEEIDQLTRDAQARGARDDGDKLD